MKNTTLLERASNRPRIGAIPGSERVGAPSRGRVIGLYAAGSAILLLALSFVGEGFSPGAVFDSWRGEADPQIVADWWWLRIERLLFAAGVGGALSLCGVAFQAVLRNPLADPYILGISGGASVGVLSAPWWWVGAATLGFPAFAGGIGALLLFIGAVRWARVGDAGTLILTGAVLNAAFGGMILLLFELSASPEIGLSWVMGSLGPEQYSRGDGSTLLPDVALVLGLGVITMLAIARSLDLLALGEEEAADLGIRPASIRWAVLLTGSLITAAVVAAAGPIGFVGLIVPHTVRRLHGSSHRRLIPLAVLAGAGFLMICDTLARAAIPGRALPVGIVTAFVGAPFFIGLLRRSGGRAGDGLH
jgi:iron complex transport system permease protein